MELSEVWLQYVNDHLDPALAKKPPLEFTAWQTIERFFEIHPMLTARWDALAGTPFNAEFDEVADMALVQVAATDSFASWDNLVVGAWRVISDRLMYCEIVLGVTAAREPKGVMARLPQGLERNRQTKALLLKYLLGHGRTIDRRVLPIEHKRSPQAFPATQTLRKQ